MICLSRWNIAALVRSLHYECLALDVTTIRLGECAGEVGVVSAGGVQVRCFGGMLRGC